MCIIHLILVIGAGSLIGALNSQVIWSYIGFSNVNYALAEVKNPQGTVRIAGPLAISVVAILYLLSNIAYFAGATKNEITSSVRLVAALLFRNVYGARVSGDWRRVGPGDVIELACRFDYSEFRVERPYVVDNLLKKRILLKKVCYVQLGLSPLFKILA